MRSTARLDAYEDFLRRFPRSKRAHEMRYCYASALFYSGRRRRASAEFARIRDGRGDEAFREAAAFSAAKAMEIEVKELAAAGLLADPPSHDPYQPGRTPAPRPAPAAAA